MKVLFRYLISAFALFSNGYGQENTAMNEFQSGPDVKTIMLYRSGWELGMPVIIKDAPETLELSFDFLERPDMYFSYSVVNCTWDWEISNVPEHYYMDGFNNVSISDFSPSRSTTYSYQHYKASVPSEDFSIKSSGNFLIKVFNSSNPEDILFTRKFSIAEKAVNIHARVNRHDKREQELIVSVDIGKLKLRNPLEEIKLVVVKNFDWNNRVEIRSNPTLRDQVLYYDKPGQISSEGNNEFRLFNIKDVNYLSERIREIQYQPPYFHVFLKPDEIKQYQPYFSSEDLNGRFYIDLNNAIDRHTEADYVYVHFLLNSDELYGFNTYVYGALTNWQKNNDNLMVYNHEKRAYEKTLLLKQGIYNYAYITEEVSNKSISSEMTEGNFSETENDYIIFVYLHELMSDVDRLVGYTVVNSSGTSK